MKSIVILHVLLLAGLCSNAQLVSISGPSSTTSSTVISDPMNNRPYYGNNSNVEGNLFFASKWSAGSIKTANGIHYTNMTLKYDVLNNDVVFLINDSSFSFSDEIREFVLNTGGKNGAVARFVSSSSVNSSLPRKFVLVLAEGAMSLYQHQKKSIITTSGYNLADRKILEDQNTYYVVFNGVAKSVNINKKNLEELMGAKWQDVSAYMEKNNLSAKSESGWVGAISYFNTLK